MGTYYKTIKDSYLPGSITDQGFRKLLRPKSNQSRSLARVTNRADNKEINDLYEGMLNDFNNPDKPDMTTAVEYCTLVNEGFSNKNDFNHLLSEYNKDTTKEGNNLFFPPLIDYSGGNNIVIDNNVLQTFASYNYPPKEIHTYLDLNSDVSFQKKAD